MRNIDSCYHQYNRIKKILNYIIDYEYKNNIKYDIVFKTRLDLSYYGKLSNCISEVINTNGVMYENGNDTTIISNRNDFFNIIHFIIDEFYNQTDDKSHLYPPHGLLNSAIIKFSLKNINKKNSEIIRL